MDTLCLHCSALFVEHPPSLSSTKHHETAGALIESAQHCTLCRTIQEYWSLGYLQRRFPELEGPGADSLPLKIEVESSGRCESADVVWFVLVGEIDVTKHKFSAGFSLTVTRHVKTTSGVAVAEPVWRGEPSSFEQKCETVKSWFAECAASHPECVPPQDELPERLIAVGAEDRDPRLINTRAAGISQTAYATLSHCWGNVRPMFASKANLGQLQTAIPFDTIPRTFREAIHITRRLEIPYLWIDSLCIVQDDLDDWAKEAAKMKETYSGSAVVISALDGKNCRHGCFVDSDPAVFNAEELEARVNQLSVRTLGEEAALLLRVYEGKINSLNAGHNLRTRGWTLQEELLAHREILCTQPEVRWRCQRAHQTEAGHEFAVVKSLHPSTSLDKVRWLWCDWMSDYSHRSFTFQIDRLSALVGIMQYYGNRTGYTHILACWKETMIDDLLWLRGQELVDPLTIIPSIPSWSWMTRATNVDFDFWGRLLDDDRTEEDHTKVIEANTEWAGQPLLSDLLSTKLVLEGPTQQMRLRVDPRAQQYNPPYLKVGDEEPEVSIEDGDPIPWRCAGQFDETAERDDEMFTCLLMRSNRVKVVNEKYADSAVRESFLILVQEPGEDDVYRRVGIAIIDSADGWFGEAKMERIRLV